jgi:uncharacterized secreted repeat protein (TIGR03808 family)
LTLPAGAKVLGMAGLATLKFVGGASLISGVGAHEVRLEGLVLEGDLRPLAGERRGGLVSFIRSEGLVLADLVVRDSFANAIALSGCSGRIERSEITHAGEAAIFAIDSRGLQVSANVITDCANNGILVWREAAGEDGTVVTANRIERVGALAGGTGQNGNGVNVYRAGNVLVSGNRIVDCTFTAVRGNAASNIQIIANSCARLGEVALYAEFGFEGALIANNVVDTAATGISVTNFNEGGRLAVVHGNLIRNLFRREHEIEDKRGEGIAVEADTAVVANTIENAPTVGIMIGWTRYMRDCVVASNLVRKARIGIGVTGDQDAGAVAITGNMISGAAEGAIRAMNRHQPFGPDLAATRTETGRVTITGNVSA